MGDKFTNLNIRVPENSLALVLRGLTARCIAPGWVTAAGESLARDGAKDTARELSKALDLPVLATDFFDGDYAELTVYVGGRLSAKHIPASYEGVRRVPGKPGQWREALGLPEEAEGRLKTAFSERDPETCLRLLECVLGCPLTVGAESIGTAAAPDGTYFLKYLARKGEKSKIKNAARLRLLGEVAGQYITDGVYPAPLYHHSDGSWTVCGLTEGGIRTMFSLALPAWSDVKFCVQAREGGPVFVYVSQVDGGCRGLVLTEGGELLDEFPLEGNILAETCFFLNENTLFTGRACRDLRERRTLWTTDAREGEQLLFALPLRGGNILTVCLTHERNAARGVSTLRVLSPDGVTLAERETAGEEHVESAVRLGGAAVIAANGAVGRLNDRLETQWELNLGGTIYGMWADAAADTLYLGMLDRVLAIDAKAPAVTASRPVEPGRGPGLCGVLPGVGPILWESDSMLQVWDRELRTISRHRAAGHIAALVNLHERTLVLTSTPPVVDTSSPDLDETSPGRLRFYELTKAGG